MDTAGTSAERRFYPRHRVRVAVLWRAPAGEAMTGEICDVSAHGFFLVSTSALPDDVGVGVHTQVTLRTKTGEHTLVGKVRWRGFHPLHQAIGCGIYLDDASVEIVARIFPILRQDPLPEREAPRARASER
jgi:hypothetical protein